MDYLKNHLCGYSGKKETLCSHFLYADEPGMMHGKKELKLYYAYCTANGKCRSLGCIASFTGNSPTWCPKREKLKECDKHNGKSVGR